MKNIGYVIKLYGVSNCYAYGFGSRLKYARVFPTREAARQNKRDFGGLRTEKIFQVEYTPEDGEPKRIIKEVR